MAKSPSIALDARSKLWSLAAALACALPLLLLVPHGLALALLGMSAAITALAWKRVVAMPVRVLLTGVMGFMVMYAYNFGIGRDSASAALLAMLMLKPIELTTLRDARSLIGFGLFSIFAALLLDQGLPTLALAIPAAALVFGASARMADAEVGTLGTGLNWKRVAAIGMLFALATPLALAGFWLFPRLGSPLWGVPNVAKAKIGISDNMAPGDWLDVLGDDTPAFRARFEGATPPQQALYWRGLVMWNFDGRAWTQAGWTQDIPPAPVVPFGRAIRYEITIEPTDRNYLFALDLPRAPPDEAHMNQDLSLVADHPVSSLRAYKVTSAAPARFETPLEQGVRDAALRLPPDFNPRTLALAAQWRREGLGDAQIVQRALEMYHANFSYSLAAPPLGRDSVDEFLFDTRVGFCEHFSSSFTFLMRAAGIPARVVTGYVGGYKNTIGGFVLVRQSDAHAWSEVWLPDRGWIRVDPTAAVAPERVFRHAARETGGPGGAGTIGQLFDVGDWVRDGWNNFVLRFDQERQLMLLSKLGLPKADKNTLVIVFAVVSGLLLFGIGLWQLRDRGPAVDPLTRAWIRFTTRLARARLQKLPHEPALAWARRVAPLLPEQRADVLSLSERFAWARYARADEDAAARRDLIRDLRAFRVRAAPRS